MTRQETIDVMGKIKQFYPRFFKNATADEKFQAVDRWAQALSDYSYEDILLLLKEHIRQGKQLYPEPPDFIRLYNDILKKCVDWYWQPKNPATWELSKVKETWENDRILKVVADYDNYIIAELKRLQRQN